MFPVECIGEVLETKLLGVFAWNVRHFMLAEYTNEGALGLCAAFVAYP